MKGRLLSSLLLVVCCLSVALAIRIKQQGPDAFPNLSSDVRDMDQTDSQFGGLFTTHSTLAKDTLKFHPMPALIPDSPAWGLPGQQTGPSEESTTKERKFWTRVPGVQRSLRGFQTDSIMGVRSNTNSWLQRDIHPNLIPAPRKEPQPLFYKPVVAIVPNKDSFNPGDFDVNSQTNEMGDAIAVIGSSKTKFVDLIDPSKPNTGPQSWSILSSPSIPTPPLLAGAPVPPVAPKRFTPTQLLEIANKQKQEKSLAEQKQKQQALLLQQAREAEFKRLHPAPPVPLKTVTTTTYYSNPNSPEFPVAQFNPIQTPVLQQQRPDFPNQVKDEVVLPTISSVRRQDEVTKDKGITRYPVNLHDVMTFKSMERRERDLVHSGKTNPFGNSVHTLYDPSDIARLRAPLHYSRLEGKGSAFAKGIHTETKSIAHPSGFNTYPYPLGRFKPSIVDKGYFESTPIDYYNPEERNIARTVPVDASFAELSSLKVEEQRLTEKLRKQVKEAERRGLNENLNRKLKKMASSFLATKETAAATATVSKLSAQEEDLFKSNFVFDDNEPKVAKAKSSVGMSFLQAKAKDTVRTPEGIPLPPAMMKTPEELAKAKKNTPISLMATKDTTTTTTTTTTTSSTPTQQLTVPSSDASHFYEKPAGFPMEDNFREAPFAFAKEKKSVGAPLKSLKSASGGDGHVMDAKYASEPLLQAPIAMAEESSSAKLLDYDKPPSLSLPQGVPAPPVLNV